MKKFLALILCLLMVFGLFAGCGQKTEEAPKDEPKEDASEEVKEEEPEEKVQVAACMPSVNNPVCRIMEMGFIVRAEELGYDAVVSGLDEGSLQEFVTKWESAITNGAQGIMLAWGDDGCYDFCKRAKEQGVYIVVPHFPHDYETTKDFIDAVLSCKPATYGAESAKFILDKLEEKGITEGSIAITQNSANVTENAASDAFRSAILESGTNFKVLDTVMEGGEVTEGTNKCTAIIQSNQDIVAAFGTTGSSPQTWAAAAENSGKTDLIIVGMDYVEKNVNLVNDGKVAAVVAQPLYDECVESANVLDSLFKGRTYTASESEWWMEIDAPLAYIGGEGKSDINYYNGILEQLKTFDFS